MLHANRAESHLSGKLIYFPTFRETMQLSTWSMMRRTCICMTLFFPSLYMTYHVSSNCYKILIYGEKQVRLDITDIENDSLSKFYKHLPFQKTKKVNQSSDKLFG